VTLSIITINLNNVIGLHKTILSVINQNFSDYEYIVIDGGSNDGSVDLIKEFSDKITFWKSEPDAGIYNAMNKGISASNGGYLLFLNSGDWLVNDQVLHNLFSGFSDCDFLYGNLIKIYSDGQQTVDKGFEGKAIDLFSLLRGTINHASCIIKKSLFDRYGLYDERHKIVSDWKFFLQAIGLSNSKVSYKDIDVTYFDMNGISNNNLTLRRQEREQVLEEIIPKSIISVYRKYDSYISRLEQINQYKFTQLVNRLVLSVLIRIIGVWNKLTLKSIS
jgi:glycosyltransferase involved in cell wall biosynthesis